MTKRAMAKGGIPMAALAALLAAWDAAAAGDWPRFRGPNGNSIVEDKAFDPAALAAGKKIWTAEVGKGYSAISVADGRAITMGNDGGRDTVFCFDAASGKELWRHSYPSEPGNYPGPRASPWIEKDRVYTVGYWGIVCCLETATGKVVWRNQSIRNHFSSTVLFDGSLYGCDGNAGSGDLTCLDPLTGKEKWRHKLGFGSLIVVNGHIVFFNEKGDVIAGKPSASGFQEAGRANRVVTGGKAWTAPVCAEGRLFLRNDQGSIACLSAGK